MFFFLNKFTLEQFSIKWMPLQLATFFVHSQLSWPFLKDLLLFLSLFLVDPPTLILMGHCHTGKYNGHHKVLPGSSKLMPNHNFHMDFGWSHAMQDCHVENYKNQSWSRKHLIVYTVSLNPVSGHTSAACHLQRGNPKSQDILHITTYKYRFETMVPVETWNWMSGRKCV